MFLKGNELANNWIKKDDWMDCKQGLFLLFYFILVIANYLMTRRKLDDSIL